MAIKMRKVLSCLSVFFHASMLASLMLAGERVVSDAVINRGRNSGGANHVNIQAVEVAV